MKPFNSFIADPTPKEDKDQEERKEVAKEDPKN